jgi:hypothetical protein
MESSGNAIRLSATRIVLVGLAALLLLWGLGQPYLWQDEAATAVLARRMLRYGRPLAYDGVNLITIDHSVAENSGSIAERDRDPHAAVSFYVERGDLKQDTTWKWQPWGQFVLAAASFKLLGETTLAARLPFAVAGVITVLVLFQFALRYVGDARIAVLSSVFLTCNSYWILHGRQCRYYGLSTLLLLLTIYAYTRWQRSARWGAALFILAAWCWFQVDYGTLWPVLAVLFTDAFVADRAKLWRPLLVIAVLAGAIAPFAFYYELWGRLSAQDGTWFQRFLLNLFNLNEYILPILVVVVAAVLLIRSSRTLESSEKRTIAVIAAIFFALLLWIPSVAPAPFLRYIIATAPLGCLLAAWALVRVVGNRSSIWIWVGAMIYVLTPWLSLPLHALPMRQRDVSFLRPELAAMGRNVFGCPDDPNKPVIDWLRQNARPSDEILINYEDIPLIFYLKNPIRGGIAAFRAEDDDVRPPDFVVLRRSADFGHWLVYQRELTRYSWEPMPIEALDIRCGICPDPLAQEHKEDQDVQHPAKIFVARRVSKQENR